MKRFVSAGRLHRGDACRAGRNAAGHGYRQTYLRPDPEDIARWAERVATLPGRKIGLVWASSKELSLGRRCSAPPTLFDALGRNDASFVSLQKDPAAKSGLPLPNWTDELQDYVDIATLIVNLPLIISVDTDVGHLAGALGKPVWLLERERSVWYPSLQQFCQPRLGAPS